MREAQCARDRKWDLTVSSRLFLHCGGHSQGVTLSRSLSSLVTYLPLLFSCLAVTASQNRPGSSADNSLSVCPGQSLCPCLVAALVPCSEDELSLSQVSAEAVAGGSAGHQRGDHLPQRSQVGLAEDSGQVRPGDTTLCPPVAAPRGRSLAGTLHMDCVPSTVRSGLATGQAGHLSVRSKEGPMAPAAKDWGHDGRIPHPK